MKCFEMLISHSFAYGLVVSFGGGVIVVQGLMLCFVGEVFRISSTTFDSGIGLVVNMTKDECHNLQVGALLLTPEAKLYDGAKVYSLCQLASFKVGDYLLGSVLDPLGNLLLNTSRIEAQYRWVIESPAPGIISRMSVFEPLLTGLLSVDAMIPIGRGQRELVLGDRQTGKTSLGVDAILNQKSDNVLAIYLPIGQKASSILEVFLSLVRRDAVFYLSLLVSSAGSASVCQYLSAYTGCALSEYFMLIREVPSLLMLDDLSRHAVAYREIYLLLRRPPGREAYPGEIFYVHSRLLERSAKLASALGGGSCTGIPVIETLAGDVSSYITTNVISITDGQIFLSIDLFLSGIKPACDVGLSVSRVGSSAQWSGVRLVAGSYKLELAQYVELQSFSQFASDLGEETKARLERGAQLVEMLKQYCGSPLTLSQEVGLLSLVNQEVIQCVSTNRLSQYIELYTSIPSWLMIFVPVRLVSLSVGLCLQSIST